MSWGISVLGLPEKVAEYVETFDQRLTGQSLLEFTAAKPHLLALVRQNFENRPEGYMRPLVSLEANGSGVVGPAGEHLQSALTVKLSLQWTEVLT